MAGSSERARGNGISHYVCPEPGCHRVFSRSDRLTIHLRTHTGERPFICDKEGCGKSYARAAHLTRHKQVSHQVQLAVEKYRCTVEGCPEEFVSQHNLRKHIKRKHQVARYQCTEPGCLRSFSKHQQLKVHLSEHTGVNSFVCPHEGCHQSFKIPSRLKRHMKIHTGYTCNYEGCGATFTKWTLYRKHVAVQHTSTAHTCPQCNKDFSQRQWLRQHMKIHQESRDLYVCPREDCGRSYLDQRNLQAHIRSYHDGVKFPCTHPGCERKFASEQKRVQHQNLHDPDIPLQKKRRKKKPLVDKLLGFRNQSVMEADDEDEALSLSLESDSVVKCENEEQTLVKVDAEACDLGISRDSMKRKERSYMYSDLQETVGSEQPLLLDPSNTTDLVDSMHRHVDNQSLALTSEETSYTVQNFTLNSVTVISNNDLIKAEHTKKASQDLMVDEGFSESIAGQSRLGANTKSDLICEW